jgi:hypothetical protein
VNIKQRKNISRKTWHKSDALFGEGLMMFKTKACLGGTERFELK